MFHHDISHDIPSPKRTLVRKAYFGWYFHTFCLLWNLACETGALVVGAVILDFFWALIAAVIGPPISFLVYWVFYSANRQSSAFYFCIWFVLVVLQIAAEFWFAIGIAAMGSAGLITMMDLFSREQMVLGILFLVSTALWSIAAFYHIWIFFEGRKAYKDAGGSAAATKQFGKAAVQTAYENKDTVKQVIVENKETIKQVVVENKDTIIDFAKEHKREIAAAAIENRDLVNPWENAEVMNSVFDNNKSNNP
jgi:hypothetical protein